MGIYKSTEEERNLVRQMYLECKRPKDIIKETGLSRDLVYRIIYGCNAYEKVNSNKA